jgi:hypothetical protein
VDENWGVVNNDIEGPLSSVEVGVLGVMLSASNTVSIGTMQGTDVPTFGSEQADSEA